MKKEKLKGWPEKIITGIENPLSPSRYEYVKGYNHACDEYELVLFERLEGIAKVIKNYFGYNDVETPIWNFKVGCDLSKVLKQYILEGR